MTDSAPAMLRLRSAGVGVVIGGIALAVLGLVLSFQLATLLLAGSGVAGMAASQRRDQWLRQLFLGIGAIGVIGLVEATTAAGLGVNAQQLGGAGVVFGCVDIVAGTIIHRLQSRTAS